MHPSQKKHLKRLKRKRKVARMKTHEREQKEFANKLPVERAEILYNRRHAKADKKKAREGALKELGFKKYDNATGSAGPSL